MLNVLKSNFLKPCLRLLHSSAVHFNRYTNERQFRAVSGALDEEDKALVCNQHIVPDSIDWRQLGALTRVKNQEATNSCWAFAAVAAVEAAHKIVTGELIELSEQCILDCSTVLFKDERLRGLSTPHAFRYIKKNKGLPLESAYPWKGYFGECDYNKKKFKFAPIYDFKKVLKNETALKIAVARQPVAVSLAVNHSDFDQYTGGVFKTDCGKKINHTATVVGYGTTNNFEDYWILKNSWGPTWGEQGYFKLARNRKDQAEGLCRIASEAYYPLVNGLEPLVLH